MPKPQPIHKTHYLQVIRKDGLLEEPKRYTSTADFYGDEAYYRGQGHDTKRVKKSLCPTK